MSEQILDLRRSVYELCTANPEIQPILAELGFTDITKPGMLATAGRFMTIPKGAKLKRLSMDHIKQTFISRGYRVIEE